MLCPPDPSLASTSQTGHTADQAVSPHTLRSHKAGELSPRLLSPEHLTPGRDGGDEDQQADWREHPGDVLPAPQAQGALLSTLGPEEAHWPQEAGPVSRAQDRQHDPCQLRLHPRQVRQSNVQYLQY